SVLGGFTGNSNFTEAQNSKRFSNTFDKFSENVQSFLSGKRPFDTTSSDLLFKQSEIKRDELIKRGDKDIITGLFSLGSFLPDFLKQRSNRSPDEAIIGELGQVSAQFRLVA